MNVRILGIVAAWMVLVVIPGYAQPVSPYSDGALMQGFPRLTTSLPVSSGMPYNVLIGYILGDSLARSLSLAERDSLERSLTYADTLRQAAKYLYEMVDYDPVLFYRWGSYRPDPSFYRSSPWTLRTTLATLLRKVYPDSQRTAVLCSADIIARIRVTGTRMKIDSLAARAKHAVLVTSTVIEPIKGGRIPNCRIDPQTKRGADAIAGRGPLAYAEGDQAAQAGACLQFEYRLEWNRLNHSGARFSSDSSLVDNAGREWIQPGAEYIVLLEFVGLSHDATNTYVTLNPAAWFGTTCSMYPVIDGRVYDPYDDFGIGVPDTVEQFIAALRGRIHSITDS